MKIKQQGEIRRFLITELGTDKGVEVFEKQKIFLQKAAKALRAV